MAKGTAATEAAQLRKKFGINRQQSFAKRKEIIGSGMSVEKFLESQAAIPVYNDPMDMLDAAGKLLKLAGSVEKATKAITMLHELS